MIHHIHQNDTSAILSYSRNSSMEYHEQKVKILVLCVHFGSTLSGAVHIDDEMNLSVAKVCVVFCKLKPSAWDSRDIKLTTNKRFMQQLTYRHSCTLVKHGLCTDNMQQNLIIYIRTVYENSCTLNGRIRSQIWKFCRGLEWQASMKVTAQMDSPYSAVTFDRLASSKENILWKAWLW